MPIKSAAPRLLCWDVETLPLLVATWSLRPKYIPHDWIFQEQSIVCASWMFLGEQKRAQSVSILENEARYKKDIYDDFHCIKTLHRILGKADVLLGQNADRYDFPMFQSRAKYYGLPPLPRIESIDTLKEAKKAFKLPSYKLDAMARFFLNKRKLDTGGMRLWLDIVQRDFPLVGETSDDQKARKAIQKMVKYNKKDVKLTADLYEDIKPYFKRHPNFAFYSGVKGCPKCGSTNFIRQGHRWSRNGKYLRFQCKDCFSWFAGSRSVDRDYTKEA